MPSSRLAWPFWPPGWWVWAAVLSNRVGERLRILAPAIFLGCAAVASYLVPRLGRLQVETVEQVVTVALAVILFNGGLHIGWRKLRPVAAATVWLGLAGTLLTAAALALCAHLLFGFDWRPALLLGTLWTGLKGAVPILLGAFIVTGGVADSGRLYEIVFVVVAFSVIVQGGLVPTLARRLGVPLRMVEPEPWSLGGAGSARSPTPSGATASRAARQPMGPPSRTSRWTRAPGSA